MTSLEKDRDRFRFHWPIVITVAVLMVFGTMLIAFYAGMTQNDECERQCFPGKVKTCGNTYAVCADGTVKISGGERTYKERLP